MAENKDNENKSQKKSIIASLDLKNYKPKYTDTFGNGKATAVDIDNFLEAEPGTNKDDNAQNDKKPKEIIKPKEIETDVTKVKEVTEIKKSTKVKEVDDDFERRVNAEAENDFYDEKPVGNFDRTFRSRIVDKKDKLEEEVSVNKTENNKSESIESKSGKPERGNRKIRLREPVKVNVRHEIDDRSSTETSPIENEEQRTPLRRTETYGIVISVMALLYSVSTADKALVFLSLSLLTYLIRPIAAMPFGRHAQAVKNALKGFSIALFFGAIFFAFF